MQPAGGHGATTLSPAQRAQLPTTVDHSDDLDSRLRDSIENQVFADPEMAHPKAASSLAGPLYGKLER